LTSSARSAAGSFSASYDADGGVGALGAVVGVRRGERRRLTARGARAREDEERLGDELCEGSEIPGVSVTVDRQSLEARGFSIRRSRRWLRDVDRRR